MKTKGVWILKYKNTDLYLQEYTDVKFKFTTDIYEAQRFAHRHEISANVIVAGFMPIPMELNEELKEVEHG